ncbi:hypothetical protein KGM48_00770 [Patescibacteria group bacterium]|nr:hypothetical protein [Patescibacteria group bacterium]
MSPSENRDSLIERLLTKPESVPLFRGQKAGQPVGIHFTPDEAWARNFGADIIKLKLPGDSRLKSLTDDFFEDALQKDLLDEEALWQSLFDQGYDAIVGTDSHNSEVIDVIVSPRLLQHLECR